MTSDLEDRGEKELIEKLEDYADLGAESDNLEDNQENNLFLYKNDQNRNPHQVPQFETLIHDTFHSEDVLASYTFLLEFLRRHLFQYPKLSANMGVLLLGLY